MGSLEVKSRWIFLPWISLQQDFYGGGALNPTPNPQPRGPDFRISVPQRQGEPATPQELGTHFIHLLRHI
jgi:hypothetical protein